MTCPNCQHPVPEGMDRCPDCGQSIPGAQRGGITRFTVLLILVAVAAAAFGTCALATTYSENDHEYDPVARFFFGIAFGVCVLATIGAAIAVSASRRKKP
jgi:hypothetical protein